MKTLVIVAHPNIKNSNVNKRLIEELNKYPDRFTVHQIYEAYPDGCIDVQKEQKLLEEHDNLVLQFPMYWFNCTPLLKKWLDDVFTYGWAYGSEGNALKDKKVALAISTGIDEEKFASMSTADSNMLDQLTLPLKTTFAYTKSDYRSHFAFMNANEPTAQDLEEKPKAYIEFLSSL